MNQPSCHRLLVVCLCGLSTSLLPAADSELVTRDLFISIDSQPTDFEFKADSAVGSRSGDDSFESGFGLSLGGRWSFTQPGSSLGLVVGGDVHATSYVYENDAENFTYGVRLVVGGGWAITDRLDILLEPTIEIGLADFTFPSTAAYSSYEADGSFFGYGVRINTIYRFSERWSVMGAIGWKTIENDLSGGDIDLTIEQSGFTASLGLLYRLSASPARVE